MAWDWERHSPIGILVLKNTHIHYNIQFRLFWLNVQISKYKKERKTVDFHVTASGIDLCWAGLRESLQSHISWGWGWEHSVDSHFSLHLPLEMETAGHQVWVELLYCFRPVLSGFLVSWSTPHWQGQFILLPVKQEIEQPKKKPKYRWIFCCSITNL